mmetsp:Transcript_67597/g.218300  ORF Transcript_67597/g.218300 Transcript_67597/m.218300 type:complete len:222 (+) Transcript_67597:303-968(+)
MSCPPMRRLRRAVQAPRGRQAPHIAPRASPQDGCLTKESASAGSAALHLHCWSWRSKAARMSCMSLRTPPISSRSCGSVHLSSSTSLWSPGSTWCRTSASGSARRVDGPSALPAWLVLAGVGLDRVEAPASGGAGSSAAALRQERARGTGLRLPLARTSGIACLMSAMSPCWDAAWAQQTSKDRVSPQRGEDAPRTVLVRCATSGILPSVPGETGWAMTMQ